MNRVRRASNGERGQIIPLFAVLLIGILGMMALAIDVTSAYSSRQAFRTIADAAALAGAQDLQAGTSRTITAAEYTNARNDAIASVGKQVGATPTCGVVVSNEQSCTIPGSDATFKVRSPLNVGDCASCDPARSVFVNFANPRFQLSVSRIFGIGSWNVASGAVAGLGYARSYAVVTLRPPKATGSTFNVNDIVLNSNNTVINVLLGDVGSNANMDYSGTGAVMNIDSGYGMYYFDPYFAPQWYPSAPIPPGQIVQRVPTLIEDPNYRYPTMTGAPLFDDARTSNHAAEAAVERADTDPGCLTLAQSISATAYTFMTAQLTNPDKIYCYYPGIYESGSGAKNAQIIASTGDLAILRPGAYYLKSGLDVSGRLIGGFAPGTAGVALMFDETGPGNCSSCVFSGNNAQTIALNAGSKFPRGTPGVAATAAIDWGGSPVITSGPFSPTPAVLMTLLVLKDTNGVGGIQACVVPTAAPFIEPSACDDGKNQTINIAGGGQLDLEGVQYAPTDNFAVSGSSDGNGTVGEIISWTLSYSGGTTLNQEGAGSQGPGVLRLDAACTAPGTPCRP